MEKDKSEAKKIRFLNVGFRMFTCGFFFCTISHAFHDVREA